MQIKCENTPIQPNPYLASEYEVSLLDLCFSLSRQGINREEAKEIFKDFIRTTRYNFFTPYKNFSQVTRAIRAPVIDTGIAVCIAAGFTIAAAVSIVAAGFTLFLAGGFGIGAIFSETSKEFSLAVLGFSVQALIVASGFALIAAAGALMTALIMPFSILNMASRGAATLITPAIDYFSNSKKAKETGCDELEVLEHGFRPGV